MPAGREVGYATFRGFVSRHRQTFRAIADAHKLFEEFRGVLTGPAVDVPWLDREAYLGLGVRRSLFLDEEPTYGFFPPVYYYQGRVREGLKSTRFAESYRAYIDMRGKSADDPLVAEVRRRAGAGEPP